MAFLSDVLCGVVRETSLGAEVSPPVPVGWGVSWERDYAVLGPERSGVFL
jgi:hypothetical protein